MHYEWLCTLPMIVNHIILPQVDGSKDGTPPAHAATPTGPQRPVMAPVPYNVPRGLTDVYYDSLHMQCMRLEDMCMVAVLLLLAAC